MNLFIDPTLIELEAAKDRFARLQGALNAARLEIFDLAAAAGEGVDVRPAALLPPIEPDRYAFAGDEAIEDAISLVEQFGFVVAPFVVLEVLRRGGAKLPWDCPEIAILALGDRLAQRARELE